MADTCNYPRLDWETFRSTIVQVLNPSLYLHVCFDRVVYLQREFIDFIHTSKDTTLIVSRQALSVFITSS